MGAGLFGNDSEEPAEANTPTEGDDLLTVGEGATGRIDGLGGDDDISISTETDIRVSEISSRELFWETDDGEPPLTVDGGAGNDHLVLSGGGYAVTGGAGANLIDLGDASSVAVEAGAGDTVLGGNGSGVYVALEEDAGFIGGDAGEGGDLADYVVNLSSCQLDLGAGDDRVLGGTAASQVPGGAGNGWLEGTSTLQYTGGSDRLPNHTSFDADTLDGGAGDDRMTASHGDVVSLGDGSDRLTVCLLKRADAAPVQVADFDPAADQVIDIAYGGFGDFGAGPQRTLVGEVKVTEAGGNTTITGSNGQTLAVLTGATGLSVGLQTTDSAEVTDLAGNPMAVGFEPDILITRFFDVST